MADVHLPTLVSADRNANTLTNQMFVQITDGTTGITVDSGNGGMDVNIVNDVIADEATALPAAGVMIITDDGTDAHFIQSNAAGDVKVTLDAETVQVTPDGNPNTSSNPFYVEVVAGGSGGNEVADYDQAVATAADSSTNHDYTVVGTEFLLKAIEVAASAAAKFEIQTGPIAGLASKMVAFIPKAGGSHCCSFPAAIIVPVTGTGTVRVIKTNRENQAQDLYTTIIGNDIP